MEDGLSSDDDVQNVSSTNSSKKMKMDDGSSQPNANEPEPSCSNAVEGSGDNISADPETPATNDDVAREGPSNEVLNAGTSSHNVRTIVLNISTPRRGRNYRQRNRPNHGSEGDSSRDSDDLSSAESQSSPLENNSASSDYEGVRRFFYNLCDDSDESHDSDDISMTSSYDPPEFEYSDTDEDAEEEEEDSENRQEEDKKPSVLLKPKPKNNYLILREMINREIGLTYPSGKNACTDVKFENNFYGSLNAVSRLQQSHTLNKHLSCVNSLHFHPEGKLLASGSDDTHVIIWDWAANVPIQSIKTGHKSNIFQSKFLYLNARSQINIVTCARDGQVRLLQCPPSGGGPISRRKIASHSRSAHKLHVLPSEPHCVLSAGEDGLVLSCDLRQNKPDKLLHAKHDGNTIPLYSIHGHPLDANLLALAGKNRFIRVHDRRKAVTPVSLYSPKNSARFNSSFMNGMTRNRMSSAQLTCAVYNHDGSELLGSYNNDDVYLFDTKTDVYDPSAPGLGYSHNYSGHQNVATFKGVSFFGPKSQFVVSGSDCAHIFLWDKNTESIVQWLRGSVGGAINCIETHPSSPVMATSGLDKVIRVWIPKNDSEPKFKGIERVIRDNHLTSFRPPFLNHLSDFYAPFTRRIDSDDEDGRPQFGGDIGFDGNLCTAM